MWAEVFKIPIIAILDDVTAVTNVYLLPTLQTRIPFLLISNLKLEDVRGTVISVGPGALPAVMCLLCRCGASGPWGRSRPTAAGRQEPPQLTSSRSGAGCPLKAQSFDDRGPRATQGHRACPPPPLPPSPSYRGRIHRRAGAEKGPWRRQQGTLRPEEASRHKRLQMAGIPGMGDPGAVEYTVRGNS